MRSILFHVSGMMEGGAFDAAFDARLETAIALAAAHHGHLTLLQATPTSDYVAFDGFGGMFVMNDVMAGIDARRARIVAELDTRMQHEDIGWNQLDVTGDPVHLLVSWGALNDLIVMALPTAARSPGIAMSFVGDVVLHARTPVLALPAGARFDPGGTAVVAWNDSVEAANALRAAVPLLRGAGSVRILQIAETEPGTLPVTDAAEYLSRHGIASEIEPIDPGGARPAEVLLRRIERHPPALLVMGAYGHSRAREYVFGGFTRKLLTHSPVPVLLAH